MSGKGSGRRPQQIPDEEARANWERVFGNRTVVKVLPVMPPEFAEAINQQPEPRTQADK